MTYVSSPSSPDQSQPPKSPLSPRGSWGIPAKHLEWGGASKWAGPGSSGGGGFLLCPCPSPHLALPSSYLPPAEDERSFIFYYL